MRMTANDWQLYTSSMNCGLAARALTKELNSMLREARRDIRKGFSAESSAEIVRDEMYRFMHKYRNYGAMDTEPQWALVDAINKELKTDIGRW